MTDGGDAGRAAPSAGGAVMAPAAAPGLRSDGEAGGEVGGPRTGPGGNGSDHDGNDTVSYFVADLIGREVGRGGRVVVVSDLHLGPMASAASTRAADELAELLGRFHEPGLLVIAGDGFEMLAAPPDVARILDSHPQFTDAVKHFATQADHGVVVLPGNHDGQLAWDAESIAVLRDRLGVDDVCLAVDVALATGDGRQVVRIVHGNQLDPYNAFDDPPAHRSTHRSVTTSSGRCSHPWCSGRAQGRCSKGFSG